MEEDLDALWRNYALETDRRKLTSAAIELRSRLRAAIENDTEYTGNE